MGTMATFNGLQSMYVNYPEDNAWKNLGNV